MIVKPMNRLRLRKKKYAKLLTEARAGCGKESRNGGLLKK
jgi:hypothetical protein